MRAAGAGRGCGGSVHADIFRNYRSSCYRMLQLIPPKSKLPQKHFIKAALRARTLHPLFNNTCRRACALFSSKAFMMCLNEQRRFFCVLLSSGQSGSCDCSRRRSCTEHMSSESCQWKLVWSNVRTPGQDFLGLLERGLASMPKLLHCILDERPF